MRDLESIPITLTLAETGHLVFATLHTNDASQALDRIVDVFPADKRDQIQIMLAGSLQGVITQRLIPAVSGGRVAAYEVLMGTEAVRNLVREGKSRQLRNVVATGGHDGMQTIEMDLARLVASGLITMEMAQSVSAYPKEIQAQVSTLRSQAQAQATQASGQAATSGSGQRAGEDMPAPSPSRRRPLSHRDGSGPRDNPFKSIGGVTPCPGGWLVLPGRLAGVTVIAEEAFVLRKFMEVLDYRPKFDFAAVNIPFGYPERPGQQYRQCDAEARELVGWPRVVNVHPVPCREALIAKSAPAGARDRALADPQRLPSFQVDEGSGARDPAVPRPIDLQRQRRRCRSRT